MSFKYMLPILVLLTQPILCSASTGVGLAGEVPTWCHDIEIAAPKEKPPSSIGDAARQLRSLIDKHDLSDLVKMMEGGGNCPTGTAVRLFGKWNKRHWKVGYVPSKLSERLNWVGITEQKDQLEFLLAVVVDLEVFGSFDEQNFRQFRFLNDQDAIDPSPSEPPGCEGHKEIRRGSESLTIGAFLRGMRFRKCGETIWFYRWEMGWYAPNRAEIESFCQVAEGDGLRICRK